MNVNMGLELLETLATEPGDISQALGIEPDIASADDLKTALKDFKHKGTIVIWSLGMWAKFGVEWVLKIEELDLSRAKMTDLHPNIGLLTNLTTLYLWDNQFTSLPEQIQHLTNLTTLELRYNNIPDEELAKICKLLPECDISF